MDRLSYLLLVSGLIAHATACPADDDSKVDAEQRAKLFTTLDQNGDGTLQSEEIDEPQRRAFERLLRVGDSNQDGQLTRDEYLQGLQPETPGQPDQPGRGSPAQRGPQQRLDVSRLFEMGDRDGDGRIALEDLPEPLQQRMRPLFERLGKKEITREEVNGMRRLSERRASGQNSERRELPVLRVLDQDRDGQLSRTELARITEKLSELDQNGDGRLSPGELFGVGDNRPGYGPARQRPEAPGGSDRMRRPPQTPVTPQPRPEPSQRRPERGGTPQIIRQFDTNGDGALSREEAPERMGDRFDRIDADSDGKITAGELERAFRSGRPGTQQN